MSTNPGSSANARLSAIGAPAASSLSCFNGSEADAYRQLARRWAGSVTVVTARHGSETGNGGFDGVTSTAFLTVSIKPPIILVSIARETRAASMLTGPVGFVVNLLAQSQETLSRRFARPQAERALIPWPKIAARRDARGIPVLDATLGAFSADSREVVDAGDHLIILGNVRQIWLGSAEEPLLYQGRGYARLEPVWPRGERHPQAK